MFNVRDRVYESTALALAKHGSAHCRLADDSYAAIIKMLRDAGAE
jgi:hypothetical protein